MASRKNLRLSQVCCCLVFRRLLGHPSALSLDFGCTIVNFNEVGPKRKEAMDLAHAKSDMGGVDSPSLGCQETKKSLASTRV